MKHTVTLSKDEIDLAIAAWVKQKAGFTPSRVTLNHYPPDRPFDTETWTATASED